MDRAKLIEPLVRPPKMDSEMSVSEMQRVSSVMDASGETHRLLSYMPARLQELGWCDRVREECRYWLRKNSASGQPVVAGAKPASIRDPVDIPTAEIVTALEDIAKTWVPEQLCNEIVQQIMKVIEEKLMD
ncbi:hypothetical protein AAHC03_024504 [Spirometra sp. Aus1]|nr:unnamed protein product [Spirometra erinaceieuropaei]